MTSDMSMEPRTSQVAFFALIFLLALLIDSKRRGARRREEEGSQSFSVGLPQGRVIRSRPTRFPHLNVLSLAGWRAYHQDLVEKESHQLRTVTLEDPAVSRVDTTATATATPTGGDGTAHFVAATDDQDLERATAAGRRSLVGATAAAEQTSRQTTSL
ncbi:hypothetical protein ATCC90586_003172 [Pythium insidiosum]|nr:hypothetical protein ATCC90586_003172 [Pythium insidiosum]